VKEPGNTQNLVGRPSSTESTRKHVVPTKKPLQQQDDYGEKEITSKAQKISTRDKNQIQSKVNQLKESPKRNAEKIYEKQNIDMKKDTRGEFTLDS
jgi:hypothetical protein